MRVTSTGPDFGLSAGVEMNWIKATRPPTSYRGHHLHRPNIDITDMDDIRKSFSRLKKDFKHRVGGKKRGPDRAGANTAEEGVGSPASLLGPGPRVTAGGRDEGGSGISTDASGVHSRDRSPHPKPVQADEDRDNSQRREGSRRRSRLDPNVETAAGSGPGREIKRAFSPLSVTKITPNQEPDSTLKLSPQRLCLILLLDNANTPAVPDREQRDPCPDEDAEPSAATIEKKSSWKSTAFATAKLLLRGVRDSADAFGPLKSVAGGLCFILENFDVWSYPCLHDQF